MKTIEELEKLVEMKVYTKRIAEDIASALRLSIENKEPIKSDHHEISGRYRLCGYLDDLGIMKETGLIRHVYIEDPWNTRNDGFSLYLILTRKAEKIYKRLKRDGYYQK